MVDHGKPWYTTVYHVMSWFTINGIPWHTIVYFHKGHTHTSVSVFNQSTIKLINLNKHLTRFN